MSFVIEKRKGAAAPFVCLVFVIRRFPRLDLRSVVFLRADDLESDLCVSVPVDPVCPLADQSPHTYLALHFRRENLCREYAD